MGMIVKKKASFPPIPAGTYIGILVGIVDIGEQTKEYEKGRVSRVDEFLFIFEVDGETIERGKGPEPRWQHKKITKSLDIKSNMKKVVDALQWDLPEDDFNPCDLLGRACFIQVRTKEKKSDGSLYNPEIGDFIALPKNISMPEPIGQPEPLGKTFFFDIEDASESNMKVFNALPEWIRKLVEDSSENKAKYANSVDLDPDVPPVEKVEPQEPQEPQTETAQSNIGSSNNLGDIDF